MGLPFVYPLFLLLLVGLTVFALVRAAMPGHTPRSWITFAVIVWLVSVAFMTVRAGTGLGVRLNLIPVVVNGPGSAYDAFRNFFVFLPLGLLLALLGWRIIAVLGAALVFSLAIEVTQYFTDWGRTADVNDLITNVAGAGLGWVVATLIRRAVSARRSKVATPVPAPETS